MTTPTELRRIAAQIERWATHDDVMAPGLDDALKLRGAADELETAHRKLDLVQNLYDELFDSQARDRADCEARKQ